LISVLLLTLCSLPAKAALFDYSYTFSNGKVLSGSLTGDVNGQFVDNVANVSAFMGSVAFDGSPGLFSYYWVVGVGYVTTHPAVVSFDASLNNFIFLDASTPTGIYSNDFFMVGFLSEAGAWKPSEGGSFVDQGSNYDASRWTLTEVTAAVPEPGTYAMMLAGLGLLGFALRRRRG